MLTELDKERVGYVSPAQTAVLVALLRVERRHGRATMRLVAAEAGRNVSTTHTHLKNLRRAGLVTWEPGRGGTLRSRLAVLPVAA